MSLKTLEFHPEAIAEARAAYEWYVERSPAAGNAFIEELDRAMDLIARSPQRWPAYVHDTRRYLLHRFPYYIVYRVSPEAMQVIAVAHARRRPGYWRDR